MRPKGIKLPRKPCPYCGRLIKPRYLYAYAEQPYRHKCPHGRWCAASKRKFWLSGDDRCQECAEAINQQGATA